MNETNGSNGSLVGVPAGTAPVCVGYSSYHVEYPLLHQSFQRWCYGLPPTGGTKLGWFHCGDFDAALSNMRLSKRYGKDEKYHSHAGQCLIFVQVYDVRNYPTANYVVLDTKVTGVADGEREEAPQLPDCDALSAAIDAWARAQFPARDPQYDTSVA